MPQNDAGAREGSDIDIPAMINAFLEDESSNSLELPRSLTAEQRKQAKKIAEQHGGVKCESYGYGEERQLHLFKKGKDRVRVKNTFIDDWEATSGDPSVVASKSMPAGTVPVDLLQRTLERCRENGIEEEDEPPPPCYSSEISELPELPAMPGGLQVRNTFIHIESMPAVERIVQSMPDGMFRQCLEAELSAQNPPGGAAGTSRASTAASVASATTAASGSTSAGNSTSSTTGGASPIPVPTPDVLAPGTEVVIQGLVKLPDFNGLTGVVQSLDEASGRYDVLLDGPAGQCGWRWVKVKGENCRLKVPPPPCKAPTISTDCLGDDDEEEVPRTPHWEEDFMCQAGALEQKHSSGKALSLSALV